MQQRNPAITRTPYLKLIFYKYSDLKNWEAFSSDAEKESLAVTDEHSTMLLYNFPSDKLKGAIRAYVYLSQSVPRLVEERY